MQAAILAQTGSPLIYPAEDASARSGVLVEAPKAGAAADTLAVTPLATYALATIYENSYFGGSSWTFTDVNSSTCSTYYYNFNTMPSGWDNRVSSMQGWGPCKIRISENTYQSGASYGPVNSAQYVGDAMNDRASSAWVTG